MTIRQKLLTLSLTLPLLGCAEDLTSLEGVYSIETWTENETGCDSEGPSILESETDRAIYVKTVSFFGVEFINVVSCVDLETCRSEAADDTIDLGGSAFDKGSDSAGWTGSNHLFNGSCSGDVLANRFIGTADGKIELERRITQIENAPRDSDNFCDTEAADELAAALPCGRLVRITATQVEDL